MKSDLSIIRDYVQQVAEAIAAALGIDVLVFNYQRQIVAGTGVSQNELGHQYGEKSLTGSVFLTGEPWINRNPGQSQQCKRCGNDKTCGQFLLIVAYPIKTRQQILGSFCLVATDQEQKNRLLSNEDYMLPFLERMCGLIASAVNERTIQNELNSLLTRYEIVVNSINEGIIVVNEEGYIVHLNRSATILLGVTSKDVCGISISDLIPGFSIPAEIYANLGKVETEFGYQVKNKRKKDFFAATLMPVLTKQEQDIKGTIIYFRNIHDVQTYAAKVVGSFSKYTFDDIHGQSQSILSIKKKLRKVALTDSTVLIRGESGTGKELFAQAVHNHSYRKDAPFIAINCSAIPESLMESELFGYEDGAFTGAKKGGKLGKFELAAGGTLFLDELGDMPLHLQSKLLRVLETHCIERVGGIDPISVNVRIIAATNRNLEEMVARREFRGDLYYRLSVIPVFIPPLRERKEDVLLLINLFVEKYCRILNLEPQQLDARTRDILLNYPWPGNVRELQNAIEYSINMSEPGQMILPEHLPHQINSDVIRRTAVFTERKNPFIRGWEARQKELGNELILEALEKFGYTTAGKEEAARYLGISRATLYRRLKDMAL